MDRSNGSPSGPSSQPTAPSGEETPAVAQSGGPNREESSASRAPGSEDPSSPPSSNGTPQSSPFTDFDPLAPYRGAFRRFFTVWRHVAGLLMGGHIAYVESLPRVQKTGMRSLGKRMLAGILKPFVRSDLRNRPFPEQLRRRLEILGPTFTKLGQIMAIREDLLPEVITEELDSLMDHLPPIPFAQVKAIIERELEDPVESLFRSIDPEPLAAASIAQVHRATTHDGDDVVVKVIKPGIRDVVTSDLKLLEFFGVFLQWLLPRYQPTQIIEEFGAYTKREIDFDYEADHAEIFAANFQDVPGVVFPDVHRALSTSDVLTMEYLGGMRPGPQAVRELSEAERQRVIDLGASAVIRMLYKDGFFHADLHAGNLKILPGDRPEDLQIGFIDLGMVGRFRADIRRRMLYYYYALVRGDVENAARYLLDMARVGEGGDPQGFRRAVSDMARHFLMRSKQGSISLAQVILQSLSLGGRYRIFFPVEMTLMVKALVTFEGVGRTLDPDLDVVAVSRRHVQRIFRERFNPLTLGSELLSNAPELVDVALKLPQLLTSGVAQLEESLTDQPPSDPLSGVRSSVIAGACIVGGVISVVQGGPLWLSIPLFVLGAGLAVWAR
ncbi:ubiquinone biosynthesis protein [Salinibacter ruber]|uniref:Ubiquinone biosynthesis protein ubiB n=1 Tax=Salinibacter ruber (strain M8) TaxID=761659 RepID=D5HCR7_SALRM|nr:AarF/UbiB family protein [Salinibacter ruber]MCS3696484.1 ubiquinone biosynthesis protein [Salinibacter ruber]MCS3698795.1 ubiquinone biosynthesis protein [Salinibacter ruber]MCS3750919.1 ubiquinone biosynthesis protein [Salinibacter ruber]MCS3828913.1 ubiquinone biosynthesis protein [Salinibacter ruber]CBH25822.1 Ubiquinone biosynthesis protein ubiB [Salinibacter ruber M8]